MTPAHLSFVDADTRPTQIVYDITHPLPVEYGIIEYISDEGVSVTTFTQQDIDSGLLAYRNPEDLEVGLSQPTYSFKFNGENNLRVTPFLFWSNLCTKSVHASPTSSSSVEFATIRVYPSYFF